MNDPVIVDLTRLQDLTDAQIDILVKIFLNAQESRKIYSEYWENQKENKTK